MRMTVIKAAIYSTPCRSAEKIQFSVIIQRHAGIKSQFHITAYIQRAPDLRGVSNIGIAGFGQCQCIRALHRPAGRILLLIFCRNIKKTVTQCQTGIRLQLHAFSVTFVILPGFAGDIPALTTVIQYKVDNTGNRVRAILRSSAVAQYFHLTHGACRQH